MSKSEYTLLVRGGQMSRNNSNNATNVNDTQKEEEHKKNGKLLGFLDSRNESVLHPGGNVLNSLDLSRRSRRFHESADGSLITNANNNSVKIGSVELFESLVMESMREGRWGEDVSMFHGASSMTNRRGAYDSEMDEDIIEGMGGPNTKLLSAISEIDKFNLNILQSKDWGRNPPVHAHGSAFVVPKRKIDKVKLKSLSQIAKFPRSRFKNDVHFKADHLSPPPPGKTIGHGVLPS
eukprot:TRINITY_DN9389_c0_g1_i8.p1 TRINITY_DN9389_c0_g1~~TRINITY_DN9389_c0_g1_i8.p1  ORF type:complete len:236 (-),score=24.61 TRINITY_DN9389_c0_g1_i8:132-839(-)